MQTSSSTATGTRGRPRKFDRDRALHQAMEVFWLNGFQGSSIHELSQVMKIAPPSLYAAFGSKEQLFNEALALYLQNKGNKAWHAFESTLCIREAIGVLLTETVSMLTAEISPRGCLLVLGDKGMAPASAGIHQWLQTQRNHKRQLLKDHLQQAVSRGELDANTDTRALASAIFLFMSGISIETADGASETELMQAVEEFISRWSL